MGKVSSGAGRAQPGHPGKGDSPAGARVNGSLDSLSGDKTGTTATVALSTHCQSPKHLLGLPLGGTVCSSHSQPRQHRQEAAASGRQEKGAFPKPRSQKRTLQMSDGFIMQAWQPSCLLLIYYRTKPLSVSWAASRAALCLPELAGSHTFTSLAAETIQALYSRGDRDTHPLSPPPPGWSSSGEPRVPASILTAGWG